MSARRMLLVAVTLGTAFLGTSAFGVGAARADAPAEVAPSNAVPEALMSGLAQHAARFEQMKQRGAFTMTGHIEELDGSGKPSERTDVELRSTPTPLPMDRITNVVRYTENGKDKTGGKTTTWWTANYSGTKVKDLIGKGCKVLVRGTLKVENGKDGKTYYKILCNGYGDLTVLSYKDKNPAPERDPASPADDVPPF